MTYIGNYKEFDADNKHSIREFFSKEPYPNQEKIANYLKNGGQSICSSTSIPKDVFTGESLKMEEIGREDEQYQWFSILSYYVEKYNLRLPIEFEKHILRKTN